MKLLVRLLSIIFVGFFTLLIFKVDPAISEITVTATEGQLDLSHWDMNELDTVNVIGDWEVYIGNLYEPHHFTDRMIFLLPDGFGPLSETLTSKSRIEKAQGLWTYRLQVTMPEDLQLVGLSFTDLKMASKVFVNGVHVGGSGVPAAEGEGYVQKPIKYDVFFSNDRVDTTIIVQIANHDYYNPGSKIKMTMGRVAVIQHTTVIWSAMTVAVVISSVLLAIYCFILYASKVQEEPLVFLGFVFASMAVLMLCIGVTFIYNLLPNISFEIVNKLQTISVLLISVSLLNFLYAIEPELIARRYMPPIMVAYLVVCVFTIVMPLTLQSIAFLMLCSLSLVVFIVLLIRGIYFVQKKRAVVRDRKLVWWHVILILSYLMSISNQLLLTYNIVTFTSLGQIGFLAIQVAGFAIIVQRFIYSYRRSHAIEKLRDEYFVKTSYELSTPLKTIVNISKQYIAHSGIETITSSTDSSSSAIQVLAQEQQSTVNQITEIAQHMINMLETSWDYTLLDLNQTDTEKKPVQVSVIVDIVISAIYFNYPRQSINCINEVSRKVYVWADQDRLRQILYNLGINAANAMERGTIRFTSEEQDCQVAIYVIDDGRGIPEQELDRIFDPYFRLNGNGVGLGLPISKRFAKKMGGSLEVVHSKLNEGTSFRLKLPDASEEASYLYKFRSSARKTQNPLVKKGHSLVNEGRLGLKKIVSKSMSMSVMDDENTKQSEGLVIVLDRDEYNLRNMATSLKEAAYEAILLQTADDLVELVQRENPDLIIIDFALANVSGLDIVRDLRAHWSLLELPILMMSVSSDDSDFRLALEVGANDYITKPFESWSLNARVGILISLRDALEQAVSSEMAFLHAQIKPHFIYNAISTITYFCYTDSQRAAELLTQFSRYLRLTFDTDPNREYVTLGHEIALIDAFYEIEKARFGEQIRFVKEIDPDVMHCEIPILCLQPLVENSIRHGLLKKHEGGQVKLAAGLNQKNKLEIRVSDDGVGMDEQQLAKLHAPFIASDIHSNEVEPLKPLDKTDKLSDNVERRSIGFQNIRHRIERLPHASIKILSEANIGTEVVLSFDLKSFQVE